MITEINGFTLCVSLEEHEDREYLSVMAMKGEKVYHENIYGHLKPEKLEGLSEREWLQSVHRVFREHALTTTAVNSKEPTQEKTLDEAHEHKISVSDIMPTSSSNLGSLSFRIVLNLEDGGEILKAQFNLPEKLDKFQTVVNNRNKVK